MIARHPVEWLEYRNFRNHIGPMAGITAKYRMRNRPAGACLAGGALTGYYRVRLAGCDRPRRGVFPGDLSVHIA